jgi:hypothetical protein
MSADFSFKYSVSDESAGAESSEIETKSFAGIVMDAPRLAAALTIL